MKYVKITMNPKNHGGQVTMKLYLRTVCLLIALLLTASAFGCGLEGIGDETASPYYAETTIGEEPPIQTEQPTEPLTEVVTEELTEAATETATEETTKEEIDYTLKVLYEIIPMLRKYTRH